MDPCVLPDRPSLQGELIHRRFKPLYANTAFALLCGYSEPGEILSRADALAFFDDETRAAPNESWQRLLRGPATFGRRTFHRRDGQSFAAEIYARPMPWESEPAVAMAIIDVSEQERAREALNRVRARALLSHRARRTLLANARRNVRAPLSVAKSQIRALAQTGKGENAARLAQSALAACEELSRHMDAVFDIVARPMPHALEVLAVEDDPIAGAALKVVLESLGCRVRLAASGAQALAMSARRGFDVVLMDIVMPEMDGLEAARRLRALDRPWSGAPIAALTARFSPELSDAIAEAGMDAYLRKPIDPVRLAEMLALLTSGDCDDPPTRH